MDENEENLESLPKCSGISFTLLSHGLPIDGKESFEKGSQHRTLTPSSVNLDKKNSCVWGQGPVLRKFGPVNNPMKSDGHKKRLGEKRKFKVIGDSSETLGSFSPRKILRKENY